MIACTEIRNVVQGRFGLLSPWSGERVGGEDGQVCWRYVKEIFAIGLSSNETRVEGAAQNSRSYASDELC